MMMLQDQLYDHAGNVQRGKKAQFDKVDLVLSGGSVEVCDITVGNVV